ncbi:DUF72 domain-containing protein [Terrimonas sp. NA20]|uniref:DUF72 domain-containing protein n=1 Tax=Terrimonas ginsenosidimutans TaxID=2908004 RepID=A0ABS9KPQ5_9BACT|nr:DUF72 domain-containing protein [Terrimonas ginsenosidimutans]MCG2614313.1 DUF72 domain-containing protein [Terrimonas ginsenosidimutans]
MSQTRDGHTICSLTLMTPANKIWIGTSNVVVPGNKTTFPPVFQQSSRLHYYASIFNSVEINSSFYKIPQEKTYEKWATEVPPSFRFSIKLTKEASHAKNLEWNEEAVEKFMQTAKGLGNKKGSLLIQFPGKITLDHFNEVQRILEKISTLDYDHSWHKAVEFRNNSWYISETRELLNEFSAGMVLHDHPKAKMNEVKDKADFVYLRYHGPKGDYRDSYSDVFLEQQASQIKDWLKDGRTVYAYFNNTIGNAFENAKHLQHLLTSKNDKNSSIAKHAKGRKAR